MRLALVFAALAACLMVLWLTCGGAPDTEANDAGPSSPATIRNAVAAGRQQDAASAKASAPAARQPMDGPGYAPPPLLSGGLAVRVVDHQGRPVGGITVALAYQIGGQGSDRVSATTRAADGRARLDLGRLEQLRAHFQQAERALTFAVEARVASATPVRAALAGWPREDDEVELVLPPVGTVRAHVRTRDGAPLAGEARVGWWWIPADVAAADPGCAYERVPDHLVPTEAGVAVIEGVGLGLTLQFSAFATGFAGASARGIAGPRAAGEAIDVELRLGASLATIEFCVLDAAGDPLPTTRLQGELWLDPTAVPHPAAGPPRPSFLQLESDAAGRVRFTLTPGTRAAAPRLDLVRGTPNGGDLQLDEHWSVAHVALPPALVEGERVDLGVVRLAPVPVLAEGIVVDSAGQPVPHAELQFLERFGPAPKHAWHNLHDGRHTAGSDGRFRVRSPRRPLALAVQAAAKGFAPARVEFELGARALTLALAPAAAARPQGSVRLRVEVDPEAWPALVLRFAQQRGGDRAPDWLPGRTMQFDGLAPGAYDVWMTTRDGNLELARVAAVTVRAGAATEDPRLLPFDLRGLARTVQLQAVRPDGSPWRRRALRVDPLEPRSGFQTRTDDTGTTTIVLPRRIVQLDVALTDRPPLRAPLPADAGVMRVVLTDD